MAVAYPRELSVAGWAARHREDGVPGRWPYGLDRLGRPDTSVRVLDLAPDDRAHRAWARVARRRLVDADLVLTWDENAAGRLGRQWRAMEHGSGVVWLTDDVGGRFAEQQVDMLRRCAATWVLSDAQRDPLQQLLGPGHPVHVVRFGIDTTFFRPAPYPARPVVFSAGNDRHRDTATLMSALGLVHEAVPGAELLVQSQTTGTPPKGVTVVRDASHSGIRQLHARAGVVAVATHPNLHVSGMTVALEANATGRPVVMTRTPGVEGYLRHGVDALLVPPHDPEALAAAVIRLLEDPRRAGSMGEAGRAKVERDHTEQTMADQLLAVATAIVGHRSGDAAISADPRGRE
ncbi:MAG: glycosyltransferase family 4 protein [Lapillicoccus sp.]